LRLPEPRLPRHSWGFLLINSPLDLPADLVGQVDLVEAGLAAVVHPVSFDLAGVLLASSVEEHRASFDLAGVHQASFDLAGVHRVSFDLVEGLQASSDLAAVEVVGLAEEHQVSFDPAGELLVLAGLVEELLAWVDLVEVRQVGADLVGELLVAAVGLAVVLPA